MKKSSKTSKINRSLGAKAVLALLLVALWGCDMRPETTWAEHRSVRNVSGILDDSLALVVTGREWWVDDPLTMGLGPGYSDDGIANIGINIVNYREKRKSLWVDSLDFDMLNYSLLDSKIFTFTNEEGLSNSLYIWTLYHKKPKKITYKWEPVSGCETVSMPNTARSWLSGKIALLPKSLSELNDSCGFALLDTATGVVSTFYAKGEWQWLRACKDTKAFGDHVFCLAVPHSGACGADIFVDGVRTDSLRIDSCKSPTGSLGWRGDYFSVSDIVRSVRELYYFVVNQKNGKVLIDFDLIKVNSNRWSFITDSGKKIVIYEGDDL